MKLSIDLIRDGEIHRAIVAAVEPIGTDWIVDFSDQDRPGDTHRSFVILRGEMTPLRVGDEVTIRHRLGTSMSNPTRWEFVERTREANSPHVAETPQIESAELISAS